MEYAIARGCERKSFEHPVSFEISASGRTSRNLRKDGVCVDISDRGLGVETTHAVRSGTILKFYIPVKEVEIKLPVYAQVMWSKPTDDHFRMGLRFLA